MLRAASAAPENASGSSAASPGGAATTEANSSMWPSSRGGPRASEFWRTCFATAYGKFVAATRAQQALSLLLIACLFCWATAPLFALSPKAYAVGITVSSMIFALGLVYDVRRLHGVAPGLRLGVHAPDATEGAAAAAEELGTAGDVINLEEDSMAAVRAQFRAARAQALQQAPAEEACVIEEYVIEEQECVVTEAAPLAVLEEEVI